MIWRGCWPFDNLVLLTSICDALEPVPFNKWYCLFIVQFNHQSWSLNFEVESKLGNSNFEELGLEFFRSGALIDWALLSWDLEFAKSNTSVSLVIQFNCSFIVLNLLVIILFRISICTICNGFKLTLNWRNIFDNTVKNITKLLSSFEFVIDLHDWFQPLLVLVDVGPGDHVEQNHYCNWNTKTSDIIISSWNETSSNKLKEVVLSENEISVEWEANQSNQLQHLRVFVSYCLSCVVNSQSHNSV